MGINEGQKVYEIVIGSGTYYTSALSIQEALDQSQEWARDALDTSDKTIKSIICIAVIDF